MNKILQKGKLIYKADNTPFAVGEIRKELRPDMATVYVFDINKEKIKSLKKIDKSVNSTILPGVDFDKGYKQEFTRVPFFITMRVPDKRRSDIFDILQKLGLQFYDAFTVMLKLKGKSLDNWEVEEVHIN